MPVRAWVLGTFRTLRKSAWSDRGRAVSRGVTPELLESRRFFSVSAVELGASTWSAAFTDSLDSLDSFVREVAIPSTAPATTLKSVSDSLTSGRRTAKAGRRWDCAHLPARDT